jgi:hypothetical protein
VLALAATPVRAAPLPGRAPSVALAELGVALLRLNLWSFGWPLSLALAALALVLDPTRRDLALGLALGGLALRTLLDPHGTGALFGPTALLPALPILGALSARAIDRARAYAGAWPLTVCVACLLVAGASFWRVVALGVASVQARHADVAAAVRAEGIERAVIAYDPLEVDYVPPWLTIADPLIFLPDGTPAVTWQAARKDHHAYRFYPVYHLPARAHGLISPLD